MAKENDIFNPKPKVQNMNFLFEEEEKAAQFEATQTAPAARRPRPEAPRKLQQVSPRKNRPMEARKMEEEAEFFQTRAVLAKEARPKQAEEAAQKPREIEPLEVHPRKVRPQEASPRRTRQEGAGERKYSREHGAERPSSARRTKPSEEAVQKPARPERARQATGDAVKKAPKPAPEAKADRALKADMVGHAALTEEAALSEITLPEAKQKTETKQKPAARQKTEARPKQQPRKSMQQPHHASASARRAPADPNRVNRAAAADVYDGETYSERRGENGGGKTKKKKRSGFKKFILVYVLILVVILIVGAFFFNSFLRSLEKSQPSQIAMEVADNFAPEKVKAYLTNHKDAINSFGDPAVIIDAVAEKVQGAEKISYIENKDYRADSPSYNITADGTTVAKLTLANDGSGSFGLSKWKIGDLNVTDYVDTSSFEFLAPVGTTITIDGIELDDKYLTGEENIPEFLQNASKYVNIPSFLTYKAAGIAGSPNIVAKDANGKELKMTATDDKYVIGVETSDSFVKDMKPFVEDALEAWGKHFINMGGSLSSYIMEDSDWYTYIFGGPDMDPILTSLYEFESIANYEFTDFDVSNFVKYTDDCFTVDVRYKMKIDFTTDQMSDENQQLDATWVFVTKNDGKDWYIVDCIYKQEQDQK